METRRPFGKASSRNGSHSGRAARLRHTARPTSPTLTGLRRCWGNRTKVQYRGPWSVGLCLYEKRECQVARQQIPRIAWLLPMPAACSGMLCFTHELSPWPGSRINTHEFKLSSLALLCLSPSIVSSVARTPSVLSLVHAKDCAVCIPSGLVARFSFCARRRGLSVPPLPTNNTNHPSQGPNRAFFFPLESAGKGVA